MNYEINGTIYKVIINKKKIKHLYMRYKNGIIYVNAPIFVMKSEIIKLLDNNTDYFMKMINKINVKNEINMFLGEEVDIIGISNLKTPEYSKNKLYVKNRDNIYASYMFLAKQIFKERLDAIYDLFEENIPYPTLKIRKMTSRWGVCNRKNNSITLNLELLKYNIESIDYVIIHELSHFINFNHSPSFWNVVYKYCPSYKIIRKNLRE